MKRVLLFALLCPLALWVVHAQQPAGQQSPVQQPAVQEVPAPDGLRPGGTLTQDRPAPPIAEPRTSSRRLTRAWPQQPPVIPHSIRGYQVDRNFNQCLSCHSRSTTALSGAPMVSITHFTDRDGQDLAAVSPRRYFCVACHVPQHGEQAPRPSNFITIDQVLQQAIERGE